MIEVDNISLKLNVDAFVKIVLFVGGSIGNAWLCVIDAFKNNFKNWTKVSPYTTGWAESNIFNNSSSLIKLVASVKLKLSLDIWLNKLILSATTLIALPNSSLFVFSLSESYWLYVGFGFES